MLRYQKCECGICKCEYIFSHGILITLIEIFSNTCLGEWFLDVRTSYLANFNVQSFEYNNFFETCT